MIILDPQTVDREEATSIRHALIGLGDGKIRDAVMIFLESIEDGETAAVFSSVENDLLSTSDASLLLKVSRPTLYKMLDAGILPFEPAGSHRRIRLRDIHDFINRRDADRLRFAEDVGHAAVDERALLAQNAGVAVDELRELGY